MSEQKTQRTIICDGPHATEVLNVLGAGPKLIPSSSLIAIKEKAIEVLRKSVDPIAGPPDQPSDGLLYGLIQSGKTSVIQVAAAMAADNGFQCVLILTSYIDLLYDQTLKRMKFALQGLNVLGKNDWRDPLRFERQLRNPPFVIVCPKNGPRLSGLLEAFKVAKSRGISSLIIDDEADLASLNTRTAEGGEEVSRINGIISELRDFFRVNTYLQVTATPQALFLQNPDHRYRPSFTILSEPGPGYVGGSEFFGDPDGRLLKYVDIHEVEELKTSHQPTPSATIPKDLRKALLTFLVGAAAKKIENPGKRYAFLCHVSINKKDHAHIVTLIEKFKEETSHILSEGSNAQKEKLKEDLDEAYHDLKATQVIMPPLEHIIEKIKFYLHGASVKLINATSGEEIELDAVFNIFVGGNKLGRGVTIDNLIVSYYGRNPKTPNMDTVLQHARMYGYRQNDIGVTRLFLPEKLADQFGSIHDTDNALRDLVHKYPEGKLEVLWIAAPLQATRRNVLDPNSLVAYVAGESINPRNPLRTQEAVQCTQWLDEKLKSISDKENGRETTVNEILELLKKCPKDPKAGGDLWDMKTIETALDTIKKLLGNKAYLVIRRGRNLKGPRGERKQIISGTPIDESKLAPTDAPTLFLYRQEPNEEGEAAVWWPQLRFPEGNRNYVLAFSINNDGDES